MPPLYRSLFRSSYSSRPISALVNFIMRWSHGFALLCLLCFIFLAKDLNYLLEAFDTAQFTFPPLHIYIVLLSYIASLAVLGAVLPGKIQPGLFLANGTRLKYKCNGLLVTGFTVTALVIAAWNDFVRASWLADNYLHLFLASNVFAFALSTYLFTKGRLSAPRNWLRPHSIFYDFFLGSELNPFILGIDVKFFSYRPALCGWLVVNISFLGKQYQELGFITGRMMLYQMATAWYVCDYFVHEAMMVTTWDIIAENFGLMLVWGDYVFIVFGFR